MLSIFSANELFISQLNGPNFTAWYAEVLVARMSKCRADKPAFLTARFQNNNSPFSLGNVIY